MKKRILLPLFLSLSVMAFGQVWQNDLNGVITNVFLINSATNNPYTVDPGETVASNVTVSGITRSPGLNGESALAAFGATGFPNANAINLNAYFEFTLTPASGYKLNLSGFSYTAGPGLDFIQPVRAFAFRSSLDGFVGNIGNPDLDGTTISLSASQYQNITSPITFRLYAYNGSGGSNYWEIQDFRFDGVVALPVDFGSLQAEQKNNAVAVKWTTLKETNNSYFEVQASKDGNAFTTVKTISSKNGNSDAVQEYEVTITASDIAGLMAAPVLLALLGMGFSRRKRLIAGTVALSVLAVSFIGCARHSDAIEVDMPGKVFIRIKQVDKDGAFKYSEVIQVVRK